VVKFLKVLHLITVKALMLYCNLFSVQVIINPVKCFDCDTAIKFDVFNIVISIISRK
jgi:hypothetical protein